MLLQKAKNNPIRGPFGDMEHPYFEFLTHYPNTQVDSGLWELPGDLDFGKTPLEAGVGETIEETGTLLMSGDPNWQRPARKTLIGSSGESYRIHIIYTWF